MEGQGSNCCAGQCVWACQNTINSALLFTELLTCCNIIISTCLLQIVWLLKHGLGHFINFLSNQFAKHTKSPFRYNFLKSSMCCNVFPSFHKAGMINFECLKNQPAQAVSLKRASYFVMKRNLSSVSVVLCCYIMDLCHCPRLYGGLLHFFFFFLN